MSRDVRILRGMQESPWAILPSKLEAILEVIHLHAAGSAWVERSARSEFYTAAKQSRRVQSSGGQVAVLELFGTVSQRMNMLSEFSGGTSTESFTKDFRAALNDDQVSSILINIDSPGGNVFGVEELASEIFRARGIKRIVSVANSMAASAAYWIGSAASEFVVTPGGEVGSIGVFAVHVDQSSADEEAGFKTTLIGAGKFKTEGNPHEPLGEEAREAIQSRVTDYYNSFVRSVATARGVSPTDVRNGFGQGRVVGAKEAVALGMADRVGTFDETLARLASGKGGARFGGVASESIDQIAAAQVVTEQVAANIERQTAELVATAGVAAIEAASVEAAEAAEARARKTRRIQSLSRAALQSGGNES